jgi:hypothetical protein
VVIGKSNKDSFVEFLCIHHGTEIRNHRELEQNVVLFRPAPQQIPLINQSTNQPVSYSAGPYDLQYRLYIGQAY